MDVARPLKVWGPVALLQTLAPKSIVMTAPSPHLQKAVDAMSKEIAGAEKGPHRGAWTRHLREAEDSLLVILAQQRRWDAFVCTKKCNPKLGGIQKNVRPPSFHFSKECWTD